MFNTGEVLYTYRVFTTPAVFQFQSSVRDAPPLGADSAEAAPVRFFSRNYGVRVNFNTGGRVGAFQFQAFLVNLIAGLGLLGVSAAVLELVAFNGPLRAMYRRLRDAETVSISELRKVGAQNPEALRALIAHFSSAPAMEEGQPPEVVQALRAGKPELRGPAAALEMGVVNPSAAVAAWK